MAEAQFVSLENKAALVLRGTHFSDETCQAFSDALRLAGLKLLIIELDEGADIATLDEREMSDAGWVRA